MSYFFPYLQVESPNHKEGQAPKKAQMISFLAVIMAAIQCGLGFYFLGSDVSELNYGQSIFTVMGSSFTVLLLFSIVDICTLRSRFFRFPAHILLVTLYALFWFYQNQMKSLLGYTLFKENFFQIFQIQALNMIVEIAGVQRLKFVAFCLFLFIPVDILLSWKQVYGKALYGKRIILALSVFYCVLVYSVPFLDPLAYFVRDAAKLTLLEWQIGNMKIAGEFPYFKKVPTQIPPIESQPHIFLLQVESFNQNFVESKSPENHPYTPFYNSLIQEGYYVEKFYGPSIQTARGQFMIHCGVPESMTSKIFIAFYQQHFHCLPEILKEAGYNTLYFHNFYNGNFDNGAGFMARNGFEVVKSMNEEFLVPEDMRYIWGWGLQDNMFYTKYFAYLDKIENKNPGKRRYFTSLLTVSSHMMFDQVPYDQRYMYREQKDIREAYSNAIRVTDEYLKVFMEQIRSRPYLKNSIIIITGDHSYPVGEHGNYNNAVGYYEESFRTPFLMIWKDHIVPSRESKVAYSQLDIAPTLLKLLHLEVPNHFAGLPMLEKRVSQHPIPLIQPYGGIYVGNLLYPFKYIKHLASGKEFLFNLETDAREDTNLIDTSFSPSVLAERREALKGLFLNQALLEKDQIWPTKTDIAKSPASPHPG